VDAVGYWLNFGGLLLILSFLLFGPEDDSFVFVSFGDGFSGGVGELQKFCSQVDGHFLFENHFDESFSGLHNRSGTL